MDKLRRQLLAGTALMVVLRPAPATPQEQAAAIRAFTGGAVPREGKVTLDVPQLVDNGNAVPLTVSVESPMTANEHVAAIAIFNERNPQVDVVTFTLGPRAGKAMVSTRIRLATSQKLVAVARMSDGSYWSGSASMVVTLAACVEGEG